MVSAQYASYKWKFAAPAPCVMGIRRWDSTFRHAAPRPSSRAHFPARARIFCGATPRHPPPWPRGWPLAACLLLPVLLCMRMPVCCCTAAALCHCDTPHCSRITEARNAAGCGCNQEGHIGHCVIPWWTGLSAAMRTGRHCDGAGAWPCAQRPGPDPDQHGLSTDIMFEKR